MLLTLEHVTKTYQTKNQSTQVLKDINFQVAAGEFVAIMGESGSGKSTLLNIIASYDQVTSGRAVLNGQDLSQLSDEELADFRRDQMGFVFQDFNLLDIFTNKDNLILPLVLSDESTDKIDTAAHELAEFLGISELMDKYPYQISGGQKQRVAIGRALICQPQIVLADEPTGALDSKSSDQILNLFEAVNQKGNTILMVTHSIKAAARAGRVLFIKDGIIYHELYRGDDTPVEFQDRIAHSLSVLNASGV